MALTEEESRDLPWNAVVTWNGYRIARGERDLIWVTKDHANPMPGACCFKTVDQAKKGIAALALAKIIAGDERPELVGDAFWSLMELSRPIAPAPPSE